MSDSGSEPADSAATPGPSAAPAPAGASQGRSATSYEVIARRYRPRTFREVVGQEAIAETLAQAIEQGRLGHAYLFCGPRGVGKTSMARIFARALQCPNVKDGDPCDACPVCERIFRGEDIDVVEMDGASHRGIDDVRELIQHVRYAPNDGPYRIFIIDEVHMLTREAFNSLLKTLEEPPSHVKFFFATTEPEKVLPTVLSRCQRFDFSPISPADIVRRLAQICEAEGATPEEGLLEKIASLARGGMRDSQSMLDQLLSFAGTHPSAADLDRITGRLSSEAVEELLGLVERGERAAVVTGLEEIGRGGTDPAVLLEQVIEALRERLHAGVASGWGEVEIDRNLLAQEILQEARARIRRLGRADIVLELALLRLSTLADLVPISRWTALLGDGSAPHAAAAAPAVRREPRRPAPPPRREPQDSPPAPSSRAVESPPESRPEAEPPRRDLPPETQSQVSNGDRVETTARSAASDRSDRPESPAPAEQTEDEPATGSSRIAALRAALDAPARAPQRRGARPSILSSGEEEAPPIDGSDPRRAVQEAMSRVSGSVHRMVGEQFTVTRGSDETVLEISRSAIGMLGEKSDALRRELVRAFSTPVHIAEGEFEEASVPDEPAAEEAPEPVVPLADAEVPEIVEKAREIFRGELFRGAPPRR